MAHPEARRPPPRRTAAAAGARPSAIGLQGQWRRREHAGAKSARAHSGGDAGEYQGWHQRELAGATPGASRAAAVGGHRQKEKLGIDAFGIGQDRLPILGRGAWAGFVYSK